MVTACPPFQPSRVERHRRGCLPRPLTCPAALPAESPLKAPLSSYSIDVEEPCRKTSVLEAFVSPFPKSLEVWIPDLQVLQDPQFPVLSPVRRYRLPKAESPSASKGRCWIKVCYAVRTGDIEIYEYFTNSVYKMWMRHVELPNLL